MCLKPAAGEPDPPFDATGKCMCCLKEAYLCIPCAVKISNKRWQELRSWLHEVKEKHNNLDYQMPFNAVLAKMEELTKPDPKLREVFRVIARKVMEND